MTNSMPKMPTLSSDPKRTIFDLKYFYQLGEPYQLVNANQFPFREAVPLYLKSQLRKAAVPNNEFLFQNINKKLDKYFKTENPSLSKKYKESWKLVGLREILMGLQKKNEINSLKDHWFKKLSKIYDKKLISMNLKKYPRLKEFIEKKRKGDLGRMKYFDKLLKDLQESHGESPKRKWLSKRFKQQLDFTKQNIRYSNVLLQMMMGNRKYNKERASKIQRATTLLNVFQEIFGTNVDLSLNDMLKKDKKRPKKKRSRRVMTFLVHTKPRFDERRALQSICKKHFNQIFLPPKMSIKQERLLTRENFMQQNRTKIKKNIKLPSKRSSLKQYAFKGKFFEKADLDNEILQRIRKDLSNKGIEKHEIEKSLNHDVNKNVKTEILPYNLPEYEKMVYKTNRPKRIDGFFKFFEDFQGIFSAKGEEILSIPPEKLNVNVSVTDFIRKKKWEEVEQLATSVSSHLTLPPHSADSSRSSEDGGWERQHDVEEKETPVAEERLSSVAEEGEKEVKKKPSAVQDEAPKKGGWRLLSVKKATYIILRFLHDMAKERYLPEKKIIEDSLSEHSSLSPPSSESVKLPPLFALKSILSEQQKDKPLKAPLKYLEKCAKNMYNKIKKNKKVLLEKCHEHEQLFADKSGISPANYNSFKELLDKWDTEKLLNKELVDVSSLSTLYSESDESAMYEIDPTIFDYEGHPRENKNTPHVEVLSLLILFLSVAHKIINVRRALRNFKEERNASYRKNLKLRRKQEKSKKAKNKADKVVFLPHFRNFLEKSYGLLGVDEYMQIAQRYCPDYVFYETKKDLKKPKAQVTTGSGEEIGLPIPAKDSKGVVFSEMDVISRKHQPEKTEDEEKQGTLKTRKKKMASLVEEDKSYISWKGPPCEGDFSSEARMYFMKHSTEWAPFLDFSDITVDKKFVSSQFFEFPSSLGIPRLVTRYYRHLPSLKLPETYILDPTPESLKWDSTCWTESEKKLPYYEKYDEDVPWMSRYFNVFWITENKKEFSREDVQNLIFSSWCGNMTLKGDDTVKLFDKFREAIDNFEKEKKGPKRIYDVDRPGQHTWEWLMVTKYFENVSPIDLLGINKWYRDLNKMYNEAEYKDGSRSTIVTVMSTSQLSTARSQRSSAVEMEFTRANERVEDPEGFPVKDFNSLKEVVTSFIELVKKFRSYRVAPYGERYRPITEYYLKCITEECGYVETNEDPNDHPNIRLAPTRAICYSDKEKQFYYHSNNFIDHLQKKFPQRFLKMPFHVRNEYGSMKHVCTFVSTRRLSFPELNTWKGCMRTVANKFYCEPLASSHRPPRMMKSPFTTLQERKGNVFELSILLTGFLIAAGYDAYCVAGTATYHRALYGNTDDVSPDESDVEPPSTHRYKQYNLLPPFSSRWYRDSSAYFDPLPYDQMEISQVKRNKKKLFFEEYSKWPKTDREVLAEYDKETVAGVEHKSRFDNPAIALPGSGRKELISKEEGTAEDKEAKRKLDDLYEKLITERGLKEEEERRKAAEKKMSMRTYIHETPTEPKSSFVDKMLKKNRLEKFIKKRENKNKKNYTENEAKAIEEDRYFSWLYGPNGPHPEYSEMLLKDRERAKRVPQLPEINLLQFIDMYDPQKHRLEVLTGERLHYYERDSYRCKKKLKRQEDEIWMTDMKRIERILMRRAQYKKADEPEHKKRRLDDVVNAQATDSSARFETKLRSKKPKKKGKPKTSKLVTAKDIKISPNVSAVTHRTKLIESPFIRKLWLNLSKEFSESHSFQRVKEIMGFSPKKIKRQEKADIKVENFTDAIKLLEGTYYLKHLNPATLKFVEPILLNSGKLSSRATLQSLMKARSKQKLRKKISKSRASKLLKKGSYIPSKIHCWVLVKEGTRNVTEPFFIDVFTGVRYPVTDKNYLKISCVWNDKNYYIPRYVATFHAKTREFDLRNNMYWFHLLPLEPMSGTVEKKRKPWWWDIKGHPHVLQHIEMPPYWGRRVRVPPLEWDKMFANTNKKTFYYKRTTIEVYDKDGRPADGLVKRISKYLDMKRTILESVDTKYEMRKDRLMWRHFDANSGFVEERFEEGRPDHLKCMFIRTHGLPLTVTNFIFTYNQI